MIPDSADIFCKFNVHGNSMFRIVDPPPNFRQSASEWIYKVSLDNKNVRSMRNLPRRSLCQMGHSGGKKRERRLRRRRMSRSHKSRNAAQHEWTCLRRSGSKRITWDPHVDLKVHSLEKLRWPWDRSSDRTMVSRAILKPVSVRSRTNHLSTSKCRDIILSTICP